ncbi:MAG: hypothetical protein ACJ8FK_08755 [Xanthobacteraceae bacterium]
MDWATKDLLVQAAGVLALIVSIIHDVLGETIVFATARIEPERLRRLIRLVWQCSTVAWIGIAILLIAAPYIESRTARHWIVAVAVAVYGFAAAANTWATRGRHFGGLALAAVIGLAVSGL